MELEADLLAGFVVPWHELHHEPLPGKDDSSRALHDSQRECVR
jgi:hypothetical protein